MSTDSDYTFVIRAMVKSDSGAVIQRHYGQRGSDDLWNRARMAFEDHGDIVEMDPTAIGFGVQ